MSLFVDTSVWSLAFRRDGISSAAEALALVNAIEAGQEIVTTGLVLQELLQGFVGPKNRDRILDRFSTIPLLIPERDDHMGAAELRNRCRRAGVQIGTIDALLAELCIRHELTMLSTDGDFQHIAAYSTLDIWNGKLENGSAII